MIYNMLHHNHPFNFLLTLIVIFVGTKLLIKSLALNQYPLKIGMYLFRIHINMSSVSYKTIFTLIVFLHFLKFQFKMA
jgi:hypothetical protein